MHAEQKYLSDLTNEQIKFRIKMIDDILDMLRNKYCCSRVVLENGRDYRLMSYENLIKNWKNYFPEYVIPKECRI